MTTGAASSCAACAPVRRNRCTSSHPVEVAPAVRRGTRAWPTVSPHATAGTHQSRASAVVAAIPATAELNAAAHIRGRTGALPGAIDTERNSGTARTTRVRRGVDRSVTRGPTPTTTDRTDTPKASAPASMPSCSASSPPR
ncbi:hypothetical protein ACFQV2_30405 [Actinokineospora soli]|uniref:Uncharacterized protein n=1 Tax=Actinokineospora soli TaxID=1048753 RepID=A0ABW2TT99_9PSEU